MPTAAVVSLKGGVGKTTLAVHLAFFVYDTLKDTVVLVDGDPIGSSARWSKRGPGFPFPVVGLDEKVPKADWLVVDTEGHPDPSDLEALARDFDLLVLPVADAESLETAIELSGLLQQSKAKFVSVVNRAPPWPQTDGDAMWTELERYKMNPTTTLIPASKAFVTAKLEGTSVLHCSQRNRFPVWSTFERFGREVVKHVE